MRYYRAFLVFCESVRSGIGRQNRFFTSRTFTKLVEHFEIPLCDHTHVAIDLQLELLTFIVLLQAIAGIVCIASFCMGYLFHKEASTPCMRLDVSLQVSEGFLVDLG